MRERNRETTSTVHLWDGQNIVAEVGANEQVNARYLRGINLIVRELDGKNQYYIFNAHGDVIHRIDTSRNILKTYKYDAFGNEESPQPLDTNPFRYCGEYFDKETGEIYLRARNYDPQTGRFTNEDSVRSATYTLPNKQQIDDPLSLNLYIYCHDNPILYIDLTGNSPRTYKVKQKKATKYHAYQPMSDYGATVQDPNAWRQYSKKGNYSISMPTNRTRNKTKPISDPFWGESSGPRWGYSADYSTEKKSSKEQYAQLFDVGGGMARTGFENEDIGDIYLTGPSGDMSLGTSGLELGGSLLTGGITIYSPTICNHRLEINLEGKAFGLGVTYGITDEGRFKFGATALFGGSISYGIVKVS